MSVRSAADGVRNAGAKKFTMIPPQVAREGSKKTVFVNFKDMCKKMHRTMEHVMSYFNAELGVPCSLDPEGKLTFKGRFTPKQIESVVRKYMIAYVQCQMCKNFDSNLVKESATPRYFFVPDVTSALGPTSNKIPISETYKSSPSAEKSCWPTSSPPRGLCPHSSLFATPSSAPAANSCASAEKAAQLT